MPELINILNHAEPPVLLFEADFAPMIPQFREHCPSIRIFVALDEISGDRPEDELQYEPTAGCPRTGGPRYLSRPR